MRQKPEFIMKTFLKSNQLYPKTAVIWFVEKVEPQRWHTWHKPEPRVFYKIAHCSGYQVDHEKIVFEFGKIEVDCNCLARNIVVEFEHGSTEEDIHVDLEAGDSIKWRLALNAVHLA